ncbi:MAG: DUF3592 domain-containing protein [Thermoanaerobaculia bacterium]
MLLTLAPPPRHVPLSLRVLNLVGGGSLIGWVIFGFGMIFVWAFGANADFSFLTFAGEHARIEGRVTKVETTNASENSQKVWANHYQYSVAGQSFTGKSYSKGTSAEQGSPVTIEYDENNPARSRIEGMRRAMFGPWAVFVVIFPSIGLIIVIVCVRGGLKRNRLLRDGMLTTGKLVSKAPTNTTINKQRVYELKFEYLSTRGRAYATARTHQTDRLQDEAQEMLLYDPNDNTSAFLLDELPTRPQVMSGELQGRPVAAFFSLLVPLIVIGLNAFMLWLKLIL